MNTHYGHRTRILRSVLSFAVAVGMIGGISYLGVTTYKDSHAATGASLYITPNSASVTAGSTVSVTLREDSGSEAVNSVQATLTYDANLLQFSSMTEAGSFPLIAATNTSTPGVVRLARGMADGSVTGDKAVVTLNFKVIGSGGSAGFGIDKSASFLVRSSDNTDILQNVGSGSFAVAPNATQSAAAASGAKPALALSPAGGSYATGSTIQVAVRLNSFDTAVTTVEAAIGYPADQLQYAGTAEGGKFTTRQRTNNTAGVVDIIRAIPGGNDGLKGDNAVVTISFKVIGNGGTAALSLTGASAVFDATGSGQNVLDTGSSKGASYTIAGSSAGGDNQADTSQPASFSVISPAQALTAGYENRAGRVALTTTDSGEAVTELSGQVSLTPVIDQSTLSATPGEAVSKVEYFIDKKLASTQTAYPYAYKFDTTSLRNGSYSVTVLTHYKSGKVDTRTDTILVNNKVTLSYVARHYGVSLFGSLALLLAFAVLLRKLIIPRFNRPSAAAAAAAAPDHDVVYGYHALKSLATPAAPVAADPTVITPQQAGTPAAAVGQATSLGQVYVETASAVQTTQALPQAVAAAPAAAMSLSQPTIQPATTAVGAPNQPVVASPAQPATAAGAGQATAVVEPQAAIYEPARQVPTPPPTSRFQ